MADDIASIGIRIDTSDLVRGEKALRDVREAGRQTGQTMNRLEDNFRSATARVGGHSERLNQATSRQRNFGIAAQNVSFQVQDLATQLASGTSATQALGQQLPQLLGGFGAIGAAAGAAVAVVGGLVQAFFNSSEASKKAEEETDKLTDSIEELDSVVSSSLGSMEEYITKLDEMSSAARRFEETRLQVELQRVQEAIPGLVSGLAKFGVQFDLTDDKVDSLRERLVNLNRQLQEQTDSPQEYAARLNELRKSGDGVISVARELVQRLLEIGATEEAAALRESIEELTNYADKTRDVNEQLDAFSRSQSNTANNIVNFNDVLARQSEGYDDLFVRMQKREEQAQAIEDSNIRETIERENEALEEQTRILIEQNKGYDDLFKRRQTVNNQSDSLAGGFLDVKAELERELELLGKTKTEQEVLNEVRRAGVTLASEQGQAIAELVRQIERRRQAEEGPDLPSALRPNNVIRRSDMISSQRGELEDAGDRIRQSLLTPQEEYNQTLEELDTLLDAGAIGMETYSRAATRAGEKLEEATNLQARFGKEIQALESIGDQAFDRIGSAITRMTLEGKDGFEVLRNTGQAVISELTQAFIQLGLINPLKNALLGGDNATLNSVGGLIGELIGNAATSGGGALASVGGVGGAVPMGRANGGPVTAGEPYIVGERQPELFVPRQNGTILPSVPMGGGETNVYIENYSGQEAQVQRSPNGNGGEDVRVTIGKEMGRQIANGNFDRPMRTRYGLNPSTGSR